jgi:tetraacyldisaccharide 4'-kinase
MDRRCGAAVEGLRVVSVGNLAVGGTGKTPVTSWVACSLSEHGAEPAIVLRGYGRDEVLLHREWTPDLPVVVGGDRRAAAQEARDAGADVVVLDDGFQHRRLDRTLDLVLLAVEDPLRDRVLPWGPYREPLAALRRATAVILTRRSATVADARAFAAEVAGLERVPEGIVSACVHLVTDQLLPLSQEDRPLDRRAVLRNPLVLTAVGRPDAFLRDVEAMSEGGGELLDYEDHHEFTAEEARAARARAGDRAIVITEKDAVKLRAFSAALGEVWVARQRLAWDWGEDAITALLRGVRVEAGR